MFGRVTIHAADREASERFYGTVLPTLGIESSGPGEWGDFAVAQAVDDTAVTRRLHIGFVAPSRAHVERFWSAGTEAGYRDDGEPGPRPQYRYDYYGGFLLDPDGNSAEAVHHGALRSGGNIDHLWIRVPDVTAAKRVHAAIGEREGFHLATDTPERVSFRGESGSFSLVAGTPTENVDMTFR
jgi:hypothetical protein